MRATTSLRRCQKRPVSRTTTIGPSSSTSSTPPVMPTPATLHCRQRPSALRGARLEHGRAFSSVSTRSSAAEAPADGAGGALSGKHEREAAVARRRSVERISDEIVAARWPPCAPRPFVPLAHVAALAEPRALPRVQDLPPDRQPPRIAAHSRVSVHFHRPKLSSAAVRGAAGRAAGRLALQTFDSDAYGAHDSQGCVLDEPGLQAKMAALAAVGENQLQPLRVSRYAPEQRFAIHATRGVRARPVATGLTTGGGSGAAFRARQFRAATGS